MKKATLIRKSLVELGKYNSTNREIAEFCKNNYGFEPSPQAIYEAIGSEKMRLAENYNGRQLMDLKKYVRSKWGGDIDELQGALDVVKSNYGVL